jgi:hypothetical protein
MSIWHNPGPESQVIRYKDVIGGRNVRRELRCASGDEVDVPDQVGALLFRIAPQMRPGPAPKAAQPKAEEPKGEPREEREAKQHEQRRKS